MVVCVGPGTRVALTYYWTSGLVIITRSHFYSWKWRTLFCKIEFTHHHTVKTNIANCASDHCLCFLDDVFMKWNCGGNEGKPCYFRMEGAVLLVVCLTLLFFIINHHNPFLALFTIFLLQPLIKKTYVQHSPISTDPTSSVHVPPVHHWSTWLTSESPNYWPPANNYSHYSPNRNPRPAINDGSSRPWSWHDGRIRTAVGGDDVAKYEEDVWACCQQAWDVDDKWPAPVPHQADVCVVHRAVSDWIM